MNTIEHTNTEFCNCEACRQAFFKKYKVNYMYYPSNWTCRNKLTSEKITVVARLAKEARDKAAQQFGVTVQDIAAFH